MEATNFFSDREAKEYYYRASELNLNNVNPVLKKEFKGDDLLMCKIKAIEWCKNRLNGKFDIIRIDLIEYYSRNEQVVHNIFDTSQRSCLDGLETDARILSACYEVRPLYIPDCIQLS